MTPFTLVDNPKWSQWAVVLVGIPALVVSVLGLTETINPVVLWVALPVFVGVVGLQALAAVGHYEGYRNG